MSIDANAAAAITPATLDPRARFVVVGAGGLGCPALLALLAAGATKIEVLDFDVVEASNLQRQVLFNLGDVGASKAVAAARALKARSSELEVQATERRLDAAEVAEFVSGLGQHDVVLECTDNAEMKFAFNDACRAAGRALVIGGVVAWQGRAMAVHTQGACYRCFFEAPPPAQQVARCEDTGILGAAAGVVGHLMGALACGLANGRDTSGRLHVLDFRDLQPRVLAPPVREGCTACADRHSASA